MPAVVPQQCMEFTEHSPMDIDGREAHYQASEGPVACSQETPLDPSYSMSFCCQLCSKQQPLSAAYLLPHCPCLLCHPCAHGFAEQRLQERCKGLEQHMAQTDTAEGSADALFTVGQRVWYLDSEGLACGASIASVDLSLSPPAYGVRLDGRDSVRETEAQRLRAMGTAASAGCGTGQEEGRERCPVLGCSGSVPDAELQVLAPEAFNSWSTLATEAALRAAGITCCPFAGCGALILRMPPSANSRPSSAGAAPGSSALARRGSGGRRVSDAAVEHESQHRYRCAACKRHFCGECSAAPYHAGYTCEEAAAPKCLFCPQPILWRATEEQLSRLAVSQLRSIISQAGSGGAWCVERAELAALAGRVASVCDARDCRVRLAQACNRRLACGHWCGGVRGEAPCLPCLQGCGLQSACPHPLRSDQDCPMCWEPLAAAPALQLACGHGCHLHCAAARIAAGCPGPDLSFQFLGCPLCGEARARAGGVQRATAPPEMAHPALEGALREPLELRDAVVRLGREQLRREGLLRSERELQPGGVFDGRPADYALQRYSFFRCAKCRQPFCGGLRQCAAPPPAKDGEASEPVCGACTTGRCGAHGADLIEWKCRYCCSKAAFFCFGTHHMCEPCHTKAGLHLPLGSGGPPCPGPKHCPSGGRHPEPGEEHCLGCAGCRQVQGGAVPMRMG